MIKDCLYKMIKLLTLIQVFIGLSFAQVIFEDRNLTVQCPTGAKYNGGKCYMVQNANMRWSAADKNCKSYGMALVTVPDDFVKKYVDTLLEKYWTGLKVDNTSSDMGKWMGTSDEDVNLNSLSWGNNQPDFDMNANCVVGMREAGLVMKACDDYFPYICEMDANPKGAFHCYSGEDIRDSLVGNGRPDCLDGSDEADTGSINRKAYVGQNTGSFDLTCGKKKEYIYSIEIPAGSCVKITVSSTKDIEANADFLRIFSGSKTLRGSDLLVDLKNITSPKIVYTCNNFVLVRFTCDSTDERATVRFEWTTSISEIPSDKVVQLTANSSDVALKTPFYPEASPEYFCRSWVIKADDIISIMFLDKLNVGQCMFELWDGVKGEKDAKKIYDSSKLPSSALYSSFHMAVTLVFCCGEEGGKGFSLNYKKGVDATYKTKSCIVMSPGYLFGEYPTRITSKVTVVRPDNVQTGMSARIKMFDVHSTDDMLKVYDVNSTYKKALHSGNGLTGKLNSTTYFRSPSGSIQFSFSSDVALTSIGFEILFSIDCPALTVSKWTNLTGDEIGMFQSKVMVSCMMGYKFVQEEYKDMDNVTLTCQMGGDWDKMRTPSCGIACCGAPAKVDNGVVQNSTGVEYGDTVTYTCNGGFTLNGNATVKCQADGTWETIPTCKSSACSVKPVITNGKIVNLTKTDQEFSDVIEFVCDDGYESVGPTKATCLTSGNWSHSAPECREIVCPLPEIMNGNLNTSMGVKFRDAVTLMCNSGFHINGSSISRTSVTIRCDCDKTFLPLPENLCVDIDECATGSPCNTTSEECNNEDSSYKCTCKEGFGGANCTNIDECNDSMKMGCNQVCKDLEPGYMCECNEGYELYKYNGFNNIMVADGETGLMKGDKYYINHTCVRKTCELPEPPMNGTRLSKNITFYYMDTVEFTCDIGFIISGNTTLTCGANGNWSDKVPMCTRGYCMAPASVSGPFLKSSPSLNTKMYLGDKLTIDCTFGSKNVTRELYCTNVGNNIYELKGDNPNCSVIDCGKPEDINGANFTNSDTTLGSSFIFDCGPGFQKSGLSMENNYVVECKADQLWSFGNLTCIGQRCGDPGTPGGAEQIATSYELNKVVSYRCNRGGYTPVPPEPFVCALDNNGQAAWNNTKMPVCKDTTKPMFKNCSSGAIKIQNGTAVSYTVPTAEDNSGALKLVIVNPFIKPGQVLYQDTVIVYTAEDYDGNVETCSINVTIAVGAAPAISCPTEIYEVKINKTQGLTVKANDIVSVSGARNTTYAPGFIQANINNVGQLQRVEVNAADAAGYTSQCVFNVKTVADACFEENFPAVANGKRTCKMENGTLSCDVTCNSGHAFQDGNLTKTYKCDGSNSWTPSLPPDYCLGYDDAAYRMTFDSVVKAVGGVFPECKTAFEPLANSTTAKDKIKTAFTNACKAGPVTAFIVNVGSIVEGTSRDLFKTTYTVTIGDGSNQEATKKWCSNTVTTNFGLPPSTERHTEYKPADNINCGSNTYRLESQSNTLIDRGNICVVGKKKTILANNEEKCIPCSPGSYVSGDNCVSCPSGQYQDQSGKTACKSCTAPKVVNAYKTNCMDICPAGFISSDLTISNCKPCPFDTYRLNATYCEQCPNGSSTISQNAANSVTECKAKCDAGSYSLTGFKPCSLCPLHHYQESEGQVTCDACKTDEITMKTGTTNSSECINAVATLCNSSVTQCSGKGNCSVQNHMQMCTCNSGYTGDKCDLKQDPCDAKPCFNDGTCSMSGSEYTCTCPAKEICEYERKNDTTGSIAEFYFMNDMTPDICKEKCTNNSICVMYSVFKSDEKWKCFLYSNTSTKASSGSSSYIKDCARNKLFNGSQCEVDSRDACTSSSCGAYGMCQDLTEEGKFKCLCVPPATGADCKLVEYNCTGYCLNGGTCRKYGATRRQCVCRYGFTGEKCEDNIDECKLNPMGCLNNGMCKDKEFGYDCDCQPGVTGDHCETPPDLCKSDRCGSTAICVDEFYQSNRSVCYCDKGYKNEETCSFVEHKNTSSAFNETYRVWDVIASESQCKQKCESTANCVMYTMFSDSKCYMYSNPTTTSSAGTTSYKKTCVGVDRGVGKCQKIDPCMNCENHGICESGKCKCKEGYEGSMCQHSVDDCKNSPCENNATCQDLHLDYSCNCLSGFSGKNCSTDIDDCVGKCTNNSVSCMDKVNDYMCKCKPGWKGKDCMEAINECMSYPCQHGAACQDKDADYNCSCKQGWTGKNCDTPQDFCTTGPCQNGGQCFNMTDDYFCRCPGGTRGKNCGDFPSVCSIINACTDKGSCYDSEGTAKCNCTSDYTGKCCHLVKDYCKDANTCSGRGKCKEKNGPGFECECENGYSGAMCETYNNPCNAKPSPCPSGSSCFSSGASYVCRCPMGKTLTDKECKDFDSDFDVQLDANVCDDGVYLFAPVQMTTQQISLFLWARFKLVEKDEPAVLIALQESSVANPMPSDEKDFFLKLTNKQIILSNGTANTSFDVEDLADMKWHSIGLTLDMKTGKILYVETTEKHEFTSSITLQAFKWVQVVIGKKMTGRISRVRVYKTLVPSLEFAKTINPGVLEPPEVKADIVQGDSNIKETKCSTFKYPSLISKDVCDAGVESDSCPNKLADKKPPEVNCPKPIFVVETDRIAEIKDLNTKIKGAYPSQNVIVTSTAREDESYLSMLGKIAEVSFGTDQKKNFGKCMVPVYIKYNDDCPAPITDAKVTYCKGSSGSICGLSCGSNMALSRPAPKKIDCGKLGAYDSFNPSKPFVLPTCGAASATQRTYTFSFTYKFNVTRTCATIEKFGIHSDIKDDIQKKLNTVLRTKWSTLCVNDTCSNFNISSSCSNDTLKFTIVANSMNSSISRLNFPTNGVSTEYDTMSALRFLATSEFNFANLFAYVDSSSVAMSTLVSCDSNQALVDDMCVECGNGTFLKDGKCNLCPMGQYQDQNGQTSCKNCPGSKTTSIEGSPSDDYCIDSCSTGSFYNSSSKGCSLCPKNYYQDKEGQSSCIPCSVGNITTGPGKNSSSDCAVDCESGTERKGSCVPCQKGYYRTPKDDVCVPCDNSDFTTAGNGSKSNSDCNIRKCPPGTYRFKNSSNSNIEECVDCELGKYQPAPLMEQCIDCTDSFTTNGTGKTSQNDCKFYCKDAGKEKDDGSNTCKPCPRGSWRTANRDMVFSKCSNCTAGKTTEGEGSDSESKCSIDVCDAGQELNGTGSCVDCPYDKYQIHAMPTSAQKCVDCASDEATVSTKSKLASDCKYKCDAGKQLVNANTKSCENCPRGFYRTGNRTDYFKNCTKCDSPYTSESDSGESDAVCSSEICTPGQQLNTTTRKCEVCDFDYYQPVDMPTLSQRCQACGSGTATMEKNSTKSTDCKKVCPSGQEMDPSTMNCVACKRGFYRHVMAGDRSVIFANCTPCSSPNTTETTGSDHPSNCSIEICTSGQQLVDGKCSDCEVDTYQTKTMPTSTDKCEKCADGKGTNETKANNASLCQAVCKPGFELVGNQCQKCKQGFWNNGNHTMRFSACEACPSRYLTEDTGATSSDNCTLLDCDPGTYISGSSCIPCEIGTYQSERHQTNCKPCGSGLNTTTTGSTSSTACQAYCQPGFEGNNTCQSCKADYFKSQAGREPCQPCTGNYTSNIERKVCDVLFCDKGFAQKDNECKACEKGTYKNERGNISSCMSCDAGTTTPGIAAESKSNCSENFCIPGQYEEGSSCVDCPKGTYKSAAGNQQCDNCTTGKTTAGTKSTAESACSVVVCNEGEKSVQNVCTKCPIGEYQPNKGETSCKPCQTGQTTLQNGTKLASDCVPLCKAGEEFISNQCSKCQIGYYKEHEGNSVNCTKCPTNKITKNSGSTLQSQCNIDDCVEGSYRKDGGCTLCAKNTYQNQPSQTSCIDCPNSKITLTTGAKTMDSCIENCPSGKGYNFVDKVCKDCRQNFITNTTLDVCTKCPTSYHTFSSGASECIFCDQTCVVSPDSGDVVLQVRLTYRAEVDCSSANVMTVFDQTIKEKLIIRISNHPSGFRFCKSTCSNIQRLTVSRQSCTLVKRKRAAANNLVYIVTLPEVPADVTHTTTGQTEQAEIVLGQDITTNPSQYQGSGYVLVGVQSVSTTVICASGEILQSNNTCTKCPTGSYQQSTNCVTCPMDQYQDQIGQSSCKKCSDSSQVKIYTMGTGSKTQSSCVSLCTKNPNYCSNGGTCKEDSISVFCQCTERYSGATCQNFVQPESNKYTYVGIGVGVGGALLLITALVVCTCFLRKNSKDKKNGIKRPYIDEEQYRNPLQVYAPHNGYDGRSDRSIRQYSGIQNTAYLAEGLEYDMQGDTLQMYDNVSKRSNDIDFFQA